MLVVPRGTPLRTCSVLLPLAQTSLPYDACRVSSTVTRGVPVQVSDDVSRAEMHGLLLLVCRRCGRVCAYGLTQTACGPVAVYCTASSLHPWRAKIADMIIKPPIQSYRQ